MIRVFGFPRRFVIGPNLPSFGAVYGRRLVGSGPKFMKILTEQDLNSREEGEIRNKEIKHIQNAYGSRLSREFLKYFEDFSALEDHKRLNELIGLLLRQKDFPSINLLKEISAAISYDSCLKFMDYLLEYSQNSKRIKYLIVNSIANLYIEKDYDILLVLMRKIMAKEGKQILNVFKKEERFELERILEPHAQKQITTEDEYFITKFVIRTSSLANEPLLTAAILIKLNENGVIIRNDVIESTIDLLIINHPLYDEYQVDAIIKITSIFPQYRFNTGQSLDLINKSFNLESTALANKINTLINQKSDKNKLNARPKYIQAIYQLIRRNIKTRNRARLYYLWEQIKDAYPFIYQHDLEIVGLLIRHFVVTSSFKSLATDLFKQIPTQLYDHPDLIGPLLKHATYTEDLELAAIVVKGLKPPIQRSYLTDLLHMHLMLGDESGGERILKEIFKSEEGINRADLNAIVRRLLKLEKLDEAISLCLKTDLKISCSGYLAVMNYMIDRNIEYPSKFISQFWTNYDSLSSDSENKQLVTVVFFKHYLKKWGLIGIRDLYLRCLNLEEFHQIANPFLLNRKKLSNHGFGLPISENHRLMVLRLIGTEALKEKNLGLFKFMLQQMVLCGMEPEEIIAEWSKRYRRDLQKVGFEMEGVKSLKEFWLKNGEDKLIKLMKGGEAL